MKICPNWMYCVMTCVHRKPHKCIVEDNENFAGEMPCTSNCSKAEKKEFIGWGDTVCSKCVRHKAKGCIDGRKRKKA
jgi:hypothetical protein